MMRKKFHPENKSSTFTAGRLPSREDKASIHPATLIKRWVFWKVLDKLGFRLINYVLNFNF